MKENYYTPDSPQHLAEYIRSLDNVHSVQMTLNQFIRFKKSYSLGFKNNYPTFDGIPIKIVSGNANNIVSIEVD